MRATVAVLALGLNLVFNSLSAADHNLEGSVFIVTEAGYNVKLALVRIRLINESNVTEALQLQQSKVDSLLAEKRTKKRHALTNAAEIRRLNDLAETHELIAKRDREKRDILANFIKGFISRQRVDRLSSDERDRFKEQSDKLLGELREIEFRIAGTNQLAGQFRDQAEALTQSTAKVATELAKWPSDCSSVYFVGLPPAIATTKTDADGKFRMKVPREGRFVLAAQAERKTANGTESYYWLIRVPSGEGEEISVMLSNDNLIGVNSQESALKIDSP